MRGGTDIKIRRKSQLHKLADMMEKKRAERVKAQMLLKLLSDVLDVTC